MDPVSIKSENSWLARVQSLNYGLIILLSILACVGFTALYSAADGDFSKWALPQLVRFFLGLVLMVGIALTDIRWWYKLAWPAYFTGVFLLIIVELFGHIGMGAQRWIDLGFIKLQPSEISKIAIVMVLARIFHNASQNDTKRISFLLYPAAIALVPAGLIVMRPDLGSSLMQIFIAAGMIFLAGAPMWIFGAGLAFVICAIPIAWSFLHEFQKDRVKIFLNPELDPLGKGYHITQSKIALGSAGVEGKGFMQGTQSALDFLPEKQTDFIFTLWAEEWGLMGGLFLLTLFGLVFLYGFLVSLRLRQPFSRLLVMGITLNFSIYVFINVSMVMGLIPVVGEPLPLISYGGTSMLTTMMAFGMLMSAYVYRDSKVTRI